MEQTEKDAKRPFPKELWNKLHLQIIFYGREYSPARGLDLERDHITRTIGRKSVLPSQSERFEEAFLEIRAHVQSRRRWANLSVVDPQAQSARTK